MSVKMSNTTLNNIHIIAHKQHYTFAHLCIYLIKNKVISTNNILFLQGYLLLTAQTA